MKRWAIVVALVASFGGCTALRWGCEAKEVAYQEVRPKELLRKYEWFKNQAAALDKKKADIVIMEAKYKATVGDADGTPLKDLPRDMRTEINQSRAELVGVKSSFNSAAAEYNAQMAKINWRFCNVGDLPEGATDPLPREFAAYEM